MKRVAIVGAGVVGLYCAAVLAQRGARVSLFETSDEDFDSHGPAASRAAAGMLAPVSEAIRPAPGQHPDLDALCFASFDLWRARHAAALWSDGVRFEGAVLFAREDEDADALCARVRAMDRNARTIGRSELLKYLGAAPSRAEAVFIDDEAIANPARVLSGLIMQARRSGAECHFGHQVKSVSAGLVESHEGARAACDVVVLAPGVWADADLEAAAPALRLIRPAKGHIAPVAFDGALRATVRGLDFYMAARAPGEIVVGGDMGFDDYDRRADAGAVAALIAAAERVFPGAVRAHPEAPPWAGVRAMSPDRAPMIGPSGAEGVLVACGHSRNGWLLAPITAEIVCAHVFGETMDSVWSRFLPSRLDLAS